jgi:hypothetical protein
MKGLMKGPALSLAHLDQLNVVIGATESYVPIADEVQLLNLVMDYWTRFAAKGDLNRPHAFPLAAATATE